MSIHKYEPFTERSGSAACRHCYDVPDSEDHRAGAITQEFVERVEEQIGHSAIAWDTIDPRRIIAAVLAVKENK